ncbi:MAG: hypothetical protein PHE17_19240 [Thiothrix sp.]|jgi:hypothetical protein|uniref:hypothetical protein n=1 Tax=Thiothrix sp. TaxID=1032 RepID=UPI00263221DE|nr:hypothetical protein [Thiothrix sp.]MDD5395162.1 hypothetical protein [Thiothrix sp.]
MDIKSCAESLRDFIITRLTSGISPQPAYPNTINNVVCFTQDAGIGTYTLRITTAFTPGGKFWSDNCALTLYIDGMEIGEANNRLMEISGWIKEVVCEWGKSQQQWTIKNQPQVTLMPSEEGARYVMAVVAWRHQIPDARP